MKEATKKLLLKVLAGVFAGFLCLSAPQMVLAAEADWEDLTDEQRFEVLARNWNVIAYGQPGGWGETGYFETTMSIIATEEAGAFRIVEETDQFGSENFVYYATDSTRTNIEVDNWRVKTDGATFGKAGNTLPVEEVEFEESTSLCFGGGIIANRSTMVTYAKVLLSDGTSCEGIWIAESGAGAMWLNLILISDATTGKSFAEIINDVYTGTVTTEATDTVKETPAETTNTAEEETTQETEQKPAEGETVYVVKKGDTLSTIATKLFGDNANRYRIKEYNKAAFEKTSGKLIEGMELIIPAKLGGQERLPEIVLAENEMVYTVKSGDSLWKIAKELLGNGSRYEDLFTRNKDRIEKVTMIFEGQEIVIPAK